MRLISGPPPVRSSDGRPPYLWRKACRAKEAHAEDSSNTFSLNLGLRSEFDGARDEAGLATYRVKYFYFFLHMDTYP